MYCSAVDSNLRAEALEAVVLTGQVVRVAGFFTCRGALRGTSALRLNTGARDRLPPKWNPIPTRYSSPRTNWESAGVAGAARCLDRTSPFTDRIRPIAT